MSTLALTNTKLKQGIWEGIVTQSSNETPQIAVTHQDNTIDGVALTHDETAGHWVLRVPIPAEAISEGVQTLIICDSQTDTKIGHITLIAGEAMGDDIRAEMDLLRAELDMLKRAFRRHCLEGA